MDEFVRELRSCYYGTDEHKYRIDEDLKKQFEAFCSNIGMTMTTAFCVFAKAAVRKQKIPFEISVDPFYSASNIAYLEKKMADYKAGKLQLAEHELIED